LAAALAAVIVLAGALGQSSRPAGPPSSQPAAGPAASAPFVFIHTSDPELGPPDLPGTAKRLEQLAERANRIGAAFVLITGDLVRNGNHKAQLKALDDALKRFNMPVKAVPGNHDDLPAFRKRFGPEDGVFTYDNCVFVCLDSNDLSPARLSWLEQSLKSACQEPTAREGPPSRREGPPSAREGPFRQTPSAAARAHLFVAMHHPPEGDKRLDELFVRYGVEAVLCGHVHKTGQIPHQGYTTYFVSGTAKVRDGNGLRYRIFTVHPDRIEQQSVLLESPVEKVGPSRSISATRAPIGAAD
jgi:predicted MPP superfamily phosphohydrolase